MAKSKGKNTALLLGIGLIGLVALSSPNTSSKSTPTSNTPNSIKSVTTVQECEADQIVLKTCNGCNTSEVVYYNADCSTYSVTEQDSSCSASCPPPVPASPPAAVGFQCNCNKTCTQMSNCTEAYFQLNQCGCSERDGDSDGVPCESICQ